MSEDNRSLTNLISEIKPSQNGDTDIDSADLKSQQGQYAAQRYLSDTKDRKWLAIWTAITVSIWLVAVLSIIALNNRLLCLSDAVLIALLGTTTLNVLGLSYIVLRGHFKASEK